MRSSRVAVFLLLLLALLVAARAAAAQDQDAGRRIAERWCINCHRIDAAARGPANDAAPSFPAIAAMASTTAISLNVFLSSPHGRMPDYSLSRSEIRDVSAYILRLRDRKL
jgi:mono/diheme cytochrome c family protein